MCTLKCGMYIHELCIDFVMKMLTYGLQSGKNSK
jgi:hypothetical protein